MVRKSLLFLPKTKRESWSRNKLMIYPNDLNLQRTILYPAGMLCPPLSSFLLRFCRLTTSSSTTQSGTPDGDQKPPKQQHRLKTRSLPPSLLSENTMALKDYHHILSYLIPLEIMILFVNTDWARLIRTRIIRTST